MQDAKYYWLVQSPKKSLTFLGSRFDYPHPSSLCRGFGNGYCTYLTFNIEEWKRYPTYYMVKTDTWNGLLQEQIIIYLLLCITSDIESSFYVFLPQFLNKYHHERDFKFQNATFMRGISPKPSSICKNLPQKPGSLVPYPFITALVGMSILPLLLLQWPNGSI